MNLRRKRIGPPPRSRGQILVIVAGGMLGLFAIAGLVLEGGTIVLNRRDAQNAADLAAVAGAQVLAQRATAPSVTSNIQGVLQKSMEANGCSDGALCTWQAEAVGSGLASMGRLGATAPPNAVGIRVVVTRTPGAVLGRMLGLTEWVVSTEATALATKPSSAMAGTLLPIAICGWVDPDTNACDRARSASNAVSLEPGQIYDLTAGRDAPGGFGWLAWGGSSLSQSICTPNNPAFALDRPYDSPTGRREVWFKGASGSPRVADVSGCLHQWISSRANALVPIYDVLDEDGRYHITGIAAFVLVSLGPIDDTMQGYFVQYVPFAGDPTAATSAPDAGDATIFIGLVK